MLVLLSEAEVHVTKKLKFWGWGYEGDGLDLGDLEIPEQFRAGIDELLDHLEGLDAD